MTPLARLRGSPWLAGSILLALAAGLAAPVLFWLGLRRWPAWVGLAALLLLLFGWLERLWQRRPVSRPPRVAARRRFRVVPGGKGNGDAHDVPDDAGEKPRWLM